MAAPQGGGQQSDNSAGILWGVAAFFAAIGGIWFAFKNQLITTFMTLKLYEVNFLSYLSYLSQKYFNYSFGGDSFEQMRAAILYAIHNPSIIDFNQLLTISKAVGDWYRIPFLLFLLVLAVVVYIGNTTRVYKRTYNMKDLASLEKVNWPQINPVVGLDLLKSDLDTGPWAMAMTPLQFCKRNRLLDEVRPQRNEGMIRKEWEKIDVVLKRGQANKVFALQLGPLFTGTKNLPPHTRALFAVFAARINADSKEAAEILRELNFAAQAKSFRLSRVDQVIAKYEKTKLVQQIVSSHAYVFTMMASMLEGAREDGVQASADFLWLKPLDRKLWYILNTVGRQTPFIEIAGIFAHWVAEKEAGRKLLIPMIEEATNATEMALKEVVYRPDEG